MVVGSGRAFSKCTDEPVAAPAADDRPGHRPVVPPHRREWSPAAGVSCGRPRLQSDLDHRRSRNPGPRRPAAGSPRSWGASSGRMAPAHGSPRTDRAEARHPNARPGRLHRSPPKAARGWNLPAAGACCPTEGGAHEQPTTPRASDRPDPSRSDQPGRGPGPARRGAAGGTARRRRRRNSGARPGQPARRLRLDCPQPGSGAVVSGAALARPGELETGGAPGVSPPSQLRSPRAAAGRRAGRARGARRSG